VAKVAHFVISCTNRRRDRITWLALPMILILGLAFFLPLARLLLGSLTTSSGLSFSRYGQLFDDQVFVDVVLRTIRIAGLVTFFTAIIGYPVAYAAARAQKWVGIAMLACVILPLFTSSLVRSYAWRALLADNGVINEWLVRLNIVDAPLKLLYNDTSIVIGMTQVLLPLMILPIYATTKNLDRAIIDAARSMGASQLAAWRTMTLPQSFKGVAAGASLVFISSLGYYTTPALLGGISTPMFAQLVDSQINTKADYGPTTAESALVLIGVAFLLVILRRPLGLVSSGNDGDDKKRRLSSPLSTPLAYFHKGGDRLNGGVVGRSTRRAEELLSRVRWFVTGGLAVGGLVILVGPQVVIVLLAFNNSSFLSFPPTGYSTRWFTDYVHDDSWLGSTRLSFVVSIVAATIATVIGTLAAFGVVRIRRTRLSVAVYMLGLTPLVIPPVLYAIGLFFVFIQIGVAGTASGLVVAYAVLGIPYVVITSQPIVRDIEPLMERAAASMGANAWRRAQTIILPLIVPAVVASFLLAFIHAFDDLVVAVFLGSADTVTLQMRMYEDIQFEISPKVAAVGVLVTCVMLLLGLASMGLNRNRSRDLGR